VIGVLVAGLLAQAASPTLRVSIELQPPIWIAGTPFQLRLIVENPGTSAASFPEPWASGECLLLRAVPRGAFGRSPQPNDPQHDPTPRAAWKRAPVPAGERGREGEREFRIPSGSRLVLPVTLASIDPPEGDSFDVLFVSHAPPAAADAVRVERVEDLRGARATIRTEAGTIVLALAPEAAPLACRNFARLAESGFYDGTTFHRVVEGLCIQAGDPQTKAAASKPAGTGATYDGCSLPLERSGAAFTRGTVGLARVPDELYRQVRALLANAYEVSSDDELDAKLRADSWSTALALRERARWLESGTSQFFICTADAPQFVGRYSLFAKVVEGLDVVDAIARTERLSDSETPAQPVRILGISIERKTPR
jgi:cyclophilin family peptidyl-prolyl cis-trans isomerase